VQVHTQACLALACIVVVELLAEERSLVLGLERSWVLVLERSWVWGLEHSWVLVQEKRSWALEQNRLA